MPSTVVRGGEDSKQLTASESLESIHDAFVGSQDELRFVVLKEILNSVWAEFDNVASSVRISDKVRLNSKILVAVCWIRPQNVND